MTAIPTFKLVVVGSSGSGKSTFIRRHLTGEYSKQHNPTLGVELHPLVFHTSRGPIRFNVYDMAGNPTFGGTTGDAHLVGAHAALVFDDHSAPSVQELDAWVNKVGFLPYLNVVVCHNKADEHFRSEQMPAAWMAKVNELRAAGFVQYQISARSNYNFDKPFLHLTRRLLNDDGVRLVESPALAPPVVQLP